MSKNDASHPTRIQPVWWPFVMRPTLFASVPSALILAACFFFWQPLLSVAGKHLWWIMVAAVMFPLGLLVERLIRYSKTHYELHHDHVVVRTGTLFTERSVELDFKNVTMVEWQSPFFLRLFYDVGHVTVQEAGSSDQPAQLNYIEQPRRVYDHVGERMREHGFSMQRNRQIRRETPGYVGATVDFVSRQFALLWALVLGILQAGVETAPLFLGSDATLWKLVTGNYDVFSDMIDPGVFLRARIGIVLIGTILIALIIGWLVMFFLDLLYRQYTLHDDVIDYVDGFLNETRKYIPLEALSDTEVSRPFHKRIFGLSDVTLSSRGAENAITFRSTPNGPEFADAIERHVDKTPAPAFEPTPEAPTANPEPQPTHKQPETAPSTSPSRDFDPIRHLSPNMFRAALRGVSLYSFGMVFLVFVGLPGALGYQSADSVLDLLGIASIAFVILVTLAIVVGVTGIISTGWMIRAWATEFAFDDQGAHYTFDFFSREDRRFSLERITSVTISRDPLDWLAGTMTVRFRSVGSDDDIRFWGIHHSQHTIRALRAGLGLTGSPETPAGQLTPDYTFADGLRAAGPTYLIGSLIPAVWIGLFAYFDFQTGGIGPALVFAISLAVVLFHQAERWLYHSRITGDLDSDYLEVAGGIFRRFRHFAPLQHVRSVKTARYPGSTHGSITFRTAGFPLKVDHLPDLDDLHQTVDRALGLSDRSPGDAHNPKAFQPGAGTQALRWSWLLFIGIGLFVVPYIYAYFRRASYQLEPRRMIADTGLYYDVRTTVLFAKIDHIESSRIFAHHFSDSHDIEVYTEGSRSCDLVLRAVDRQSGLLTDIRSQLQ